MIQRLPAVLAQVKAGNTTEHLLNEIRQIKYSSYGEKEIIEKVFNNVMNSVKVQYKIDTTFLNSGNCKSSHSHRLMLNLSNKTK